MEGTLAIVVVAVGIAGAVVALVTLALSGRAYDDLGHGGLSLRDGADRPAREPAAGGSIGAAGPPGLPGADDEIRQLLDARNEVRRRAGRAPLDVEAELRALADTPPDPALEAEVRQLVVAGNERRARQGRAPLDVEAEVARRLRELRGAT